MSILSGFKKVRRRIRLPDGYKLLSFWTSSQTVEMDDGTTLESNKAKWDDASTKKHEHTNKPALDSITSEKVAKWNTLAESNVTGVKGNTESSYRTGNVNLTSANIGALPTTGGTLTGNLSFNMNSSTQTPIKIYGGDTNGQGISVGAGGATIVGGGESAKALESVVSATTEQLWLTSDNNIYFYTNCNTIGNKVGAVLDNSRQFYPNINNTGSLGTSTYRWANLYTTSFNGSALNTNGIASTTGKGIVQLTNDLSSTSTALVPTANALKTVNDKVEAIGETWASGLLSTYQAYSVSSSPYRFAVALFGRIYGNYGTCYSKVSDTELKITKTGVYIINAQLTISQTNNTGNVKRFTLYVNNADAGLINAKRLSTWESIEFTVPVRLNAGQTIKVMFQDESGGGTVYNALAQIIKIK